MQKKEETKYKNKYRIDSARASWWNYGWAGAYFITICTQDRQHILGTIENGKMQLSPTGILADVFWYEIPHHAKDISLGAFVVMPNHIHGILVLENPDTTNQSDVETTTSDVETTTSDVETTTSDVETTTSDVETTHALSLQQQPNALFLQQNALYDEHISNVETTHALSPQQNVLSPQQNALFLQECDMTEGQKRFQNQGKNTVSSIIGSYKSAVTKHTNRLGFPSGWQVRFYDHIIRDYTAYQYIENYIKTNPENWEKDKFFKFDKI